jgi:hypothetical protein
VDTVPDLGPLDMQPETKTIRPQRRSHSILKINILLEVIPCILWDYQCFGGIWYFTSWVEVFATHSSKIQAIFHYTIYDVTSRNIKTLIVTANRAPNLTLRWGAQFELFHRKQHDTVCIVNCGTSCCQFCTTIKLKFSRQWNKLNSLSRQHFHSSVENMQFPINNPSRYNARSTTSSSRVTNFRVFIVYVWIICSSPCIYSAPSYRTNLNTQENIVEYVTNKIWNTSIVLVHSVFRLRGTENRNHMLTSTAYRSSAPSRVYTYITSKCNNAQVIISKYL